MEERGERAGRAKRKRGGASESARGGEAGSDVVRGARARKRLKIRGGETTKLRKREMKLQCNHGLREPSREQAAYGVACERCRCALRDPKLRIVCVCVRACAGTRALPLPARAGRAGARVPRWCPRADTSDIVLRRPGACVRSQDKKRCDGQRPCARCARMGCECRERVRERERGTLSLSLSLSLSRSLARALSLSLSLSLSRVLSLIWSLSLARSLSLSPSLSLPPSRIWCRVRHPILCGHGLPLVHPSAQKTTIVHSVYLKQ